MLVGSLTSQQHASVSQGRICSDNCTCCHTEIEVADQTFYLTQSQYTDTEPTSPSADPITPGAWQGSYWSASLKVTGVTRPGKNPVASGIRTRESFALGADALTTRPTRRYKQGEKKKARKKERNKQTRTPTAPVPPITEGAVRSAPLPHPKMRSSSSLLLMTMAKQFSAQLSCRLWERGKGGK